MSAGVLLEREVRPYEYPRSERRFKHEIEDPAKKLRSRYKKGT